MRKYIHHKHTILGSGGKRDGDGDGDGDEDVDGDEMNGGEPKGKTRVRRQIESSLSRRW